MKKAIIISVVLFCFASDLYAQMIKIEGFGPFKILETKTEIIHKIEKDLNIDCKKINSKENLSNILENATTIIAEISPDTINYLNSPSHSLLCHNVRVFFINRLLFSEIEINNLYLTFFDEQLVKIECDGSDSLEEAMKLKYGKPKTEVVEWDSKCQLKYTRVWMTFAQSALYSTWKNGSIFATYCTLLYNRQSDCEKCLSKSFWILHEGYDKKIGKCESEIKERLTEFETSKKRNKLNDF